MIAAFRTTSRLCRFLVSGGRSNGAFSAHINLRLPNTPGPDATDADGRRYFDPSEWAALKPETPYGQLPTLTLPNGKTYAQQRALLRYLGKITNGPTGKKLYPSDPEQALAVDGCLDFLEDLWPILVGQPDAMEMEYS